MKDPVVAFETAAERDRSLDQMVDELRVMPAVDQVHRRNLAILAELIPPFVRALDRERKVFVREARAGQADALDNMLSVMLTPLVTMLGATITTMAPCRHKGSPCRACVETRCDMMRDLMVNFYQAVVSYISEPMTGDARKHNG